MQFAYRNSPNRLTVELPLLQEGLYIRHSNTAVSSDARVASTIRAKTLTKRNMDIKRSSLPQPAAFSQSITNAIYPLFCGWGRFPVGNRGIAGVTRPRHIV